MDTVILTKKEACRNLLNTSWPVIVETTLVSLISSVDIMMVGKLGAASIAAVGLTSQPRLIMLTLIISLNVGVISVVGRMKGADNQKGANSSMKISLIISTVISLFIAVLALIFSRSVLWMAGAMEDTIEQAVAYFRYIIVGNVFYSAGLTITAAQRGTGNTKISMQINLIANFINIVLNYCLIEGHFGFPALAVKGAGIATMTGNIVAFLGAFYSVCKPEGYLYIFLKTGKTEWKVIKSVCKVGGGVVVERMCHRIGLLIFFRVVASLGTVQFASYNICQRVMNFSFSIGDGLSIGAAALVAYSLGAEKPDDAKMYGRIGMNISVVASVIFAVLILIGREPLIALFTNDAAVAAVCRIGFMAVALIGIVHIPQTLLTGILRGAGDTAYMAKVVMLNTMFLRPTLTWFLCIYCNMGINGVWYCVAIDIFLRFFFTGVRFKGTKWLRVVI